MTPPPDLSILSSSEKDTLIGVLMARLDALEARVSALEAENATLRAENSALKAENATLREKLNLPPKTPDNSSKARVPARGVGALAGGWPLRSPRLNFLLCESAPN
ncbi:MAG: bZIP transcription factor [Alphaproteobacteria bacterium]|nr:bZIP transcription factor [Alphaproteobacteria bacterium]